MKTDPLNDLSKKLFLQTVGIALGDLKQQLQQNYERVYPEFREMVHLIIDEEESRAWDLTFFPHLLLPDLVEAHVAQLNLRPVEAKHAGAFVTHALENHEPVSALCA
jgi:hypothetical protein